METYSKPLNACPERRALRAPVRALLRRGACGEIEPYVTLAGLYFDIVSEHLYLCNLDRPEALKAAEILLRDGWKQLPFLKRLSDWERFLACSLMSVETSSVYSGEGPRPQALLDLESRAKFALIAFDLEDWSYRWLSLALRIHPMELRRILFEARCQLLNIDLKTTPKRLRRSLELVSADLDGQLGAHQRKSVLSQLCTCEKTKDFKSRWLDYRCELIELRQQIRLQPEERETFLKTLAHNVAFEKMSRPSVAARIRNFFSFKDLENTALVSAQRDFRFGR